MRTRALVAFTLVVGVGLTLSLIRGQEQPAPLPGQPQSAVPQVRPPENPTPAPQPLPGRDVSKLTDLQAQMLAMAQRGTDWLYRRHGMKGRFAPGHLPALNRELDSDNYIRQAGAAFALARAARFVGGEKGAECAAHATQTVLTLLEETEANGNLRHTTHPAIIVNRLAAAGVLLRAIHELPDPQKDVLNKAEQLANYIRAQAQSDGSLTCVATGKATDDEIARHVGPALCGLAAARRNGSADWAQDIIRKAATHYRAWWKEHRSPAFAADMMIACSQIAASKSDTVCGDLVFDMADWLCDLQYQRIDPKRGLWYGGFRNSQEGRPVDPAPTIESARYAEALVAACRVARERGDVAREQRYREAVGRCLQFVSTLQYTEAGTQHYAVWYRPTIIGGFHHSHQDGNLRIDYNRDAVVALFGYLDLVTP